jgi:hypothetical protein
MRLSQKQKQQYNTIVKSGQVDSILKNRISLLDWNTVGELDTQIGKSLNIPTTYITRQRVQNHGYPNNTNIKQERFLTENAHNYTFPNNFFGPYKMKCIDCGTVQEYGHKGSLLRVLGHDKHTETKRNAGLCGDCSIHTKRDWTNITQEYRDECTLRGYNTAYKTSFNTLDEFESWYETQPRDRNYKTYRREVENKSKKELKRYEPQEYERWEKNKWDGTDMNQLTIDHDTEVWECYRDNWTTSQASYISNLVVMSMRENLKKHQSKNLNGSDPKLLKSQKEKIPHHQNFW